MSILIQKELLISQLDESGVLGQGNYQTVQNREVSLAAELKDQVMELDMKLFLLPGQNQKCVKWSLSGLIKSPLDFWFQGLSWNRMIFWTMVFGAVAPVHIVF